MKKTSYLTLCSKSSSLVESAMLARRIETKSSEKAKTFHVICGLDTPLDEHSELLDHRKTPEN